MEKKEEEDGVKEVGEADTAESHSEKTGLSQSHEQSGHLEVTVRFLMVGMSVGSLMGSRRVKVWARGRGQRIGRLANC